MKRSPLLARVLVSACALLAVAGCTAASPTGGSVGAGPAEDSRVEPQATAAPAGLPDQAPEDERQVVRTGALTLRTADPEGLAARLRALAAANDGFVASERLAVDAGDGAYDSTIVLSVPTDALGRVMDEAARLAPLVSRDVTAQDVTERVVDLEARIRTLRESISRVRALMARAGSISEVAQVEQELTERQAELESLLAKQAALRGQVERAPLTVTLVRPGTVDATNPFLAGLLRGWQVLQDSVVALLTLIAGVLPFLLVGLSIGWPLWRRYRRRTNVPSGAPAPADAEE